MRISFINHFFISIVAALLILITTSAIAGNWCGPINIDVGLQGYYPDSHQGLPKMVSVGNGNVISVFNMGMSCQSIYPSTYSMIARHWNGFEWGTPQIIDLVTLNMRNFYGYKIATDGNGNAIVVYNRYDDGVYRACANRWNGSQWEGAAIIDAGTGYGPSSPQIAMNADGNAIAVFIQNQNEKNIRAYANHWNGSAWEGATIIDAIDTATYYDAGGPQIAMDANGNAIAVFIQNSYSGTWSLYDSLYANRWDGSEWIGAEMVDPNPGFKALDPQIAFDGNGNALLIYVKRIGELGTVGEYRLCSFYWNGSEWGSAIIIDAGDLRPMPEYTYPQIAFDNSDNAFVVFADYDDNCLYANRWNGTAWEGATRLDGGTGSNPFNQQIAFDECGNAMVVFEQTDACKRNLGCDHVYGTRWNGSTWEPPIRIGMGTHSRYPQIASDGKGNFIAAFAYKDLSTYDSYIYANNYAANNYAELTVRPNSSGEYTFNPGDQVWLDWKVYPGFYGFTNEPCKVYLAAARNPIAENRAASVQEIMQSQSLYIFNSKLHPSLVRPADKVSPTYASVIFPIQGSVNSGSLSFTVPGGAAGANWVFAASLVELYDIKFPYTPAVAVSNSFIVR